MDIQTKKKKEKLKFDQNQRKGDRQIDGHKIAERLIQIKYNYV